MRKILIALVALFALATCLVREGSMRIDAPKKKEEFQEGGKPWTTIDQIGDESLPDDLEFDFADSHIVWDEQPVHQSTKLSLTRTDKGYKTRLLKGDHKFPMCPTQYIDGSSGQDGNVVKKKTCIDIFNMWDHGLKFENEAYTISMRIRTPLNLKTREIGVIPIKMELINIEHEVLTMHALGNIEINPNPGFFAHWKRILGDFLGYRLQEIEVNVKITEQFANHNFDLSVLNLEIDEPNLLINEAILHLDVELRGIRWLIYKGLYLWALMIIPTSSLIMFIILDRLLQISRLLQIFVMGLIKRYLIYRKGKQVQENDDCDNVLKGEEFPHID